jgi:hypothetical protein
MAYYRLRIDLTYSSTANATTATTNINNVMIAQGYPERATRSSAQVSMIVEPIATEAAGTALLNALNSAWGSTTRSGGKVSLVRRPD